MKPVLSRAQMRAYDQFAVESCHVPGVVLMENAGRGATDVIERLLGDGSACFELDGLPVVTRSINGNRHASPMPAPRPGSTKSTASGHYP